MLLTKGYDIRLIQHEFGNYRVRGSDISPVSIHLTTTYNLFNEDEVREGFVRVDHLYKTEKKCRICSKKNFHLTTEVHHCNGTITQKITCPYCLYKVLEVYLINQFEEIGHIPYYEDEVTEEVWFT